MNKNDNKLKKSTIKDINICRQIMFMSDNYVDSRIVVSEFEQKKQRREIIMSLPQECIS